MIPLKNLARRKSKVGMATSNTDGKMVSGNGLANGNGNVNGVHKPSAVLVVGSAGSGKSSTVAKSTGQNVKVGDSVKSVTRTNAVYEISEKYDL